MQVKQISREVSHKIYLGRYETICPTLRMVADLDPGEDIKKARQELDSILEGEWAIVALREIKMVLERRTLEQAEQDAVIKVQNAFKSYVNKNGS